MQLFKINKQRVKSSPCCEGSDSDTAATTATKTETTTAPATSTTETVCMRTPVWIQKQITVVAPSRGCHLITNDILEAVASEMKLIQIGMCNLFLQHTSASLTINDQVDAHVRTDMETALNKLVPAEWGRNGTFKHAVEGDDDMPGHMKCSMMGVSLNIPISNGKLALAPCQGLYLNEHRDAGGWFGGHARNIVITLQGQSKL